jgi:hypothetical protein
VQGPQCVVRGAGSRGRVLVPGCRGRGVVCEVQGLAWMQGMQGMQGMGLVAGAGGWGCWQGLVAAVHWLAGAQVLAADAVQMVYLLPLQVHCTAAWAPGPLQTQTPT